LPLAIIVTPASPRCQIRGEEPRMDVDEGTRRLVQEWAARSGGPDVADALMAMLPPGPAVELATRGDLARMETGLRGDMAALRSVLRGEMAELRGELRCEMAELRGEMAEVRGEITELRGELVGVKGELVGVKGELVGVKGEMVGVLHRLYAANLLGMIGVAGLVLAAARLA
jgi:hypothetical protein